MLKVLLGVNWFHGDEILWWFDLKILCFAVCDGSFFPSLLNEMSDVVGFFNQKAQQLLEDHLATGIRKWMLLVKGKPQGNHVALIQEGKDLVTYALINAIAIRKILKKYDKVNTASKFWWMYDLFGRFCCYS